jgi:chromate transporter
MIPSVMARHERYRHPSSAAPPSRKPPRTRQVALGSVAREWTRIGITGFGGPPVHIALLRELVVQREAWLDGAVFEDALAACGMLPGPTSTQLAIFCAYRAGGAAGAVVGGLGFVAPSVVAILALSVLFLAENPPLWVQGAGAGAGAVVAAVALRAGIGLLGPSWRRVQTPTPKASPRPRVRQGVLLSRRLGRLPAELRPLWSSEGRVIRWFLYLAAGLAAAALLGAYLVLVLLGAGLLEVVFSNQGREGLGAAIFLPVGLAKTARPGQVLAVAASSGGIGALAWTAFKVGALAFGGGFVIVPLMQNDAVHVYHWMTATQFLNAVALGQVTPGPVVATVAAVGYAAGGIGAGVLAAVVAFAPSFAFVLLAGNRFERLRANRRARAFLDGAGPAAIGAIFGAAVTLAAALSEVWQAVLLALAAVALLALRRGIVPTLLLAGTAGSIGALAGLPVP